MRNAEKDAVDSEGEGRLVGKGRDRFLYLGTKTFLSQGCFCVRRWGERKITYANNCCANWSVDGKQGLQGSFLPAPFAPRPFMDPAEWDAPRLDSIHPFIQPSTYPSIYPSIHWQQAKQKIFPGHTRHIQSFCCRVIKTYSTDIIPWPH